MRHPIPLFCHFLQGLFILSNVAAATPVLESVLPERGLAYEQTSITLSGQDFGLNPTVSFNGIPGTITTSSDTSIIVSKPVDAGGDIAVTVTDAGQSSSNPLNFRSVDLHSLPGHFVNLVAEQVRPALLGTYTSLADQTVCTPTPAGTYAGGGASAPIACSPGYYAPTGTSSQILPPPGFYANAAQDGMVEAESAGVYAVGGIRHTASPGHYTTPEGGGQTGRTGQSLVPPGFYASGGVKYPSPGGFYAPGGTSAPIPCSPGFYTTGSGFSMQIQAPPGTVLSVDGTTGIGVVTFVGPASYAVGGIIYAVSPGAIGIGGNDAGDGSTSQAAVAPGSFAIAGVQTTCPAGFYAPGGTSAPIACSPGYYAPAGSSSQTLAAPGFYANAAQDDEVEVEPGYYAIDGIRYPITPVPGVAITAYQLAIDGENSISFQTALGQLYGVFYSENLIDYTLLESVTGTGGVVSQAITPPSSGTSKRFYTVAPTDTP